MTRECRESEKSCVHNSEIKAGFPLGSPVLTSNVGIISSVEKEEIPCGSNYLFGNNVCSTNCSLYPKCNNEDGFGRTVMPVAPDVLFH